MYIGYSLVVCSSNLQESSEKLQKNIIIELTFNVHSFIMSYTCKCILALTILQGFLISLQKNNDKP